MNPRFTIDQHDRAHRALVHAERLAALTLTAIRGRTASEVAAEVAARAVQALREKSNRGEARP